MGPSLYTDTDALMAFTLTMMESNLENFLNKTADDDGGMKIAKQFFSCLMQVVVIITIH